MFFLTFLLTICTVAIVCTLILHNMRAKNVAQMFDLCPSDCPTPATDDGVDVTVSTPQKETRRQDDSDEESPTQVIASLHAQIQGHARRRELSALPPLDWTD